MLIAVAASVLLAAPASADKRAPRIVGGNPTTIAQHPWQAALVRDLTASRAAIPRRLVGVTSFGFGCARPFAPRVYSRVGCPPLRDDVVSKVKQLTNETLPVSGNAPCDDMPPDTSITKGPKRKLKTKKKKAKAKFSASEADVAFECSIDAKGFESCTSPLRVKTKKGKHFFDVFATDRLGTGTSRSRHAPGR